LLYFKINFKLFIFFLTIKNRKIKWVNIKKEEKNLFFLVQGLFLILIFNFSNYHNNTKILFLLEMKLERQLLKEKI